MFYNMCVSENWATRSFLTSDERIPQASAYGDAEVQRPSLHELLDQDIVHPTRPSLSLFNVADSQSEKQPTCKDTLMRVCCPESGVTKFGWWDGVWLPGCISIWGVMMFVRIGWIVGQAGIGNFSLIVLLCTAVTTLTAISLSAIATNGVVKTGGVYYLISRSLGPEFGGVIGIAFAVTTAVDMAQYTIGMGETIVNLYPKVGAQKNDM